MKWLKKLLRLRENRDEREKMFTRALREAHNEIERLGRLLASHTDLISAQVENGEFEIVTRPPFWAVRAMALSFYETLNNAPNWRCVQVGPMDHEGTVMIVTVRRANGKTPEESVTLLKDLIEEMLPCIDEDCYPYTCNAARDMIKRTQEK